MTWIDGKFVATEEDVLDLLAKLNSGVDAAELFTHCPLIVELCQSWLDLRNSVRILPISYER